MPRRLFILPALAAGLLFAAASPAADPAVPGKPAKAAEAAKPANKTQPPAKVQLPAKPQPADKKPVDNKTTDPKPAEKKPVATKPVVAKPAAAKPIAAKPAKPPALLSFSKDIAPILLKNCVACHGPTDPKGEYQLHTFANAMKPGESSLAAVTPGKLDDSELFRLISTADPGERMPKDGDPLPADQLAKIKLWIQQGAKYDGPDPSALLASIVPKKIHPAPPEAYRLPIAITALAFSPNGKELAVGGYHEITIWDPASGDLLRRIKNVEERVYSLAYAPNGLLLAAAGGTPGQSGEVSLYDPAKGAITKTLGTTSDVAFGVAFNPGGTKLAACAADRSIRLYDVASGAQQRLIEDHADWVLGVAWNHDGSQLASASRDKTSKVFDAKTGESIATYPGHSETVYGVAFAPDGKQVLTCGADKRIHVWNPVDGKQAAVIAGFGGDVYKLVIRQGQIYSCSADKTARQHQLSDRKLVRTFTGHKDYVYSLDFNEPTKRLATGSFDGEVCIWNGDDGKLLKSFRAAPGYPAANAQAKK
jgi:DNA-binding beta-propeller fold protein YncE